MPCLPSGNASGSGERAISDSLPAPSGRVADQNIDGHIRREGRHFTNCRWRMIVTPNDVIVVVVHHRPDCSGGYILRNGVD